MHVEPEARKIFAWQIHPAQVGIFSYVANDIGELKSDAGLLRQLFRTRIAIAKNADADQAHNRSDVVAVIVKLVEGLVLQLRNLAVGCCLRAGHIHRGPLHQLFQQIQLDVVPLLRISQRKQHGIVGALTGRNAPQRVHPFLKLLPALLLRKRWIVSDVIGAPHKGIHRRDRIALLAGKDEEPIVKILGCRARDVPADRIRSPQLQRVFAHSNFPMAARATSHSLRGLKMAGLRVSTSYPCRSIAFNISSPLRLNSSMSRARCLSTILASGSPICNHSRARATSNFIISRNAGVARWSAMSLSLTPYFARSSSGR